MNVISDVRPFVMMKSYCIRSLMSLTVNLEIFCVQLATVKTANGI